VTRFRIALAALIALALLAVVPTAVAAKGGKSGGGSGSSTGAAIVFDPGTVVVGQQYQVKGSGFRANTWVTVGAHYSDTTWWSYGVTDSQGNISVTFTATSSGQIYHEAKEQGKNGRLRLAAYGTLTVNPA
jgi:hypothetical protein